MEKFLKSFNNRLRTEELRLRNSYLPLKAQAEDLLRKGLITDDEIDLRPLAPVRGGPHGGDARVF